MSLTRRELLGGGLAAASLCAAGVRASTAVSRPANVRWLLWYRRPASYWVEALPVGNGRLGAMVFGGTDHERLQLNEDTWWAGGPYDPSHPDARAALPEVRALLREGRYRDAQGLANARLMARPLQQMSYQTLGSLTLRAAVPGPVERYRRWLDLDRAVAVTEWQAGDALVQRRVYASARDHVLVVDYETDGEPADLVIAFSAGSGRVDGDELWHEGTNRAQHGNPGRLRCAAAVKVLADGAQVRRAAGGMSVTGARSLTLLVAARTSYRDWQHVDGDPVAAVRADLDAAAALARDARYERHLAEHRRLFAGFDLDLGEDPLPDVTTDDRIRYSHERRHDPYLAALYVQYARYLLIACSRPGTQPANLQGLWNDSDEPPWGSKYTVNINTEMNYWPAEPMGLAECVEPLVRMVEELAVSGARAAQVNYGARGWVVHHNTDLWRATAPIDGAFWGLWPTGGAWLCKHLWDRWDYGRDRAVLERIYPVLKGAALFFLDTLVELPDGSLVTSPSISPENAHHPEVSICEGPAMDRQILRELFGNVIEAARILGVDAGLAEELEQARRRLPADRTGRAGQLQEWLEDWDMDVPEIHHRHVSHLYALHPGHAIGPETPELYAAARRSLEIRGDDATGWGIGWRINLWARLGDGQRAYAVLRKLLGPERSYPNLFDAHPPFQIDGNFGGAAGILEMLVRDRPQRVDLLPALPWAWPEGHVRGVRLRGGLAADITWRAGRLVEARFTASVPVTREVAYAGEVRPLAMRAGEQRTLRFAPAGAHAARNQRTPRSSPAGACIAPDQPGRDSNT